jgi:hypothetical protein
MPAAPSTTGRAANTIGPTAEVVAAVVPAVAAEETALPAAAAGSVARLIGNATGIAMDTGTEIEMVVTVTEIATGREIVIGRGTANGIETAGNTAAAAVASPKTPVIASGKGSANTATARGRGRGSAGRAPPRWPWIPSRVPAGRLAVRVVARGISAGRRAIPDPARDLEAAVDVEEAVVVEDPGSLHAQEGIIGIGITPRAAVDLVEATRGRGSGGTIRRWAGRWVAREEVEDTTTIRRNASGVSIEAGWWDSWSGVSK